MMFRGVPRRLRFLSGALFGSMVLLLVAQTTEDHQRALLEDLIYTGSNGECWVRNDAVTGNGNWDTCGGLPGADEVTESMLKAVNGATDEYCLTYEATVGDFEWQTCASGSVTGTGTDTHIVYWTGASSLGGEAAFTYDDATNAFAVDGSAIFNDSGADADFRVEGDTDPYLLMLNAGDNAVIVGAAAAPAGVVATQRLQVYRDGGSNLSIFGSYSATATDHSSHYLLRGRGSLSSPAAVSSADDLGALRFAGYFDTVSTNTGASIVGIAGENWSGSGSGTGLVFRTVPNGSFTLVDRINILNAETVLNESAGNYDVRMESTSFGSCFFLDASSNVISTACDVLFPADSIETSEIEDGTIREVDLMAVDAASDEECLTYETTTGDFEWQACSSGGGDSITVNSSAATDPDFLNGDIDWALSGGNSITATVACTGCVDATDLATDSCAADEIAAGAVTASELADNAVDEASLKAVDSPIDEECLTYETTTGDFEWQSCGGGPASGSGTTTIDFGAFPGSADATVAVTGLTGIGASSVVTVSLRPAATADHTADEHMIVSMRCLAKDITAGVGFTIHCFYDAPSGQDTRQNGWAPTRVGLGPGARGDQQRQPPPDEESNANRIHGLWTVGYIWM